MPTRFEKLERNRAANPGKIMGMPAGLFYYNACTEPCDMAWGPCCCGAWHYGEMLPDDFEECADPAWIVLGED